MHIFNCPWPENISVTFPHPENFHEIKTYKLLIIYETLIGFITGCSAPDVKSLTSTCPHRDEAVVSNDRKPIGVLTLELADEVRGLHE